MRARKGNAREDDKEEGASWQLSDKQGSKQKCRVTKSFLQVRMPLDNITVA